MPTDTVVISSGEEKWKSQADVLRTADEFHAAGGKLVRLEFPRTEIQAFGEVAIVRGLYIVEVQRKGQRSVSSGRVTQVFVQPDGQWVNPGWHTDLGKVKAPPENAAPCLLEFHLLNLHDS